MTDAGQAVLSDPIDETRRLLRAAEAAGVPLRAVGGIGVALRAPSISRLEPPRQYHDIDLVGRAGSSTRVGELMARAGYAAADRFNKLNGSERLLFHDPDGRRVDVFLERLRMCHTLEFGSRLAIDRDTLPIADLALSKLQIVEQTPRDEADLVALLADHELTDDDAGLSLRRVVGVCANDWGWWRTVVDNLERLTASVEPATPTHAAARARAADLRDALDSAPKSAGWQLRAVIGRRKTWYDLPEEVR
jgi:hypothetical protein